MKKITVLSLCALLGSPLMSSAQSFVFASDTVKWSTPGQTAFHEMKNYFINTGTDSTAFTWFLIDTDALPSGWSFNGFCDNVTCYGSTNNWTGGVSKTSLKVAPNDSSDFKLQMKVLPEGENTTRVFRFQASTSTTTDTAYFMVTKTALGINAITLDDKQVNIYPNPSTQESINLFVNAALKATAAHFINITGQVMQSIDINGQEVKKVSIANLPAGLYSVQIMNGDGVITTRKFVKQ